MRNIVGPLRGAVWRALPISLSVWNNGYVQSMFAVWVADRYGGVGLYVGGIDLYSAAIGGRDDGRGINMGLCGHADLSTVPLRSPE